jgi:FkbM family methyltransferase
MIAFRLAWPLRWYVTHTPIRHGRTFLAYKILQPLTPNGDSTFDLEVPGGGRVPLRYREIVGFEALLNGSFERAELEVAHRSARPGTVAIDVGAHAGLFTVAMARGAAEVWAVDPLPENTRRLHDVAQANGLENVRVVVAAAGSADGQVAFTLSWDPAFGSTAGGRVNATDRTLTVRQVRLDTIWKEAGRPAVSVVKVDAEGAELEVLRGAAGLVGECRPVLLVETNDPDAIVRLLPGYEAGRPAGFAAGNWLFTG